MPPARTTGFAPEAAEVVDAMVEHLNGHHADAVTFLARHLAGVAPGADGTGPEAQLLAVDPDGVDVALGPDRTVRLPFPSAVAGADGARTHLLAALATARAEVGDGVPTTSIERELAATAALPTHHGHVVDRRPLTAALVEVRIGGLDAFAPLGPDTFAYALVSTDGDDLPAGYDMAALRQQGTDGPVRGAYYTVRHWDPTTATLVLWVVLHGHDGGVAGWMARAAPGARLGLWGPRTGFEPTPGTDLLLVADETGLAAVAAIVEQADPGVRIEAVLEVDGPTGQPPLPEHPGLHLHWCHRGGGAPGTGTRLLDAVADLDLDPARWCAFGGAESRQITAVRHHLRHVVGVPADRVGMTGYWRRSDP